MASGNTLATWNAVAGEPPAANYATLDTRNAHPVLDFDDTTSESIYFSGIMPRIYAGGGITAYLHWMATSATTNSVNWEMTFETLTAQDTDSDGFATIQAFSASTASGTSGIPVVASLAITAGAAGTDSVAAGALFRIRVVRNIADSMVGDAELLACEIKET